MNTYKIQTSARLSLPLFCVGMFCGIMFLCPFLQVHTKTFLEPAWLDTAIYGTVAVICIFLHIGTKHCGLTLNENGLIYKPFLGASRQLAYSDLQKIYIGGKAYVLYTANGKKLISFDDTSTEDASKIIAFLKAKGVKAEL